MASGCLHKVFLERCFTYVADPAATGAFIYTTLAGVLIEVAGGIVAVLRDDYFSAGLITGGTAPPQHARSTLDFLSVIWPFIVAGVSLAFYLLMVLIGPCVSADFERTMTLYRSVAHGAVKALNEEDSRRYHFRMLMSSILYSLAVLAHGSSIIALSMQFTTHRVANAAMGCVLLYFGTLSCGFVRRPSHLSMIMVIAGLVVPPGIALVSEAEDYAWVGNAQDRGDVVVGTILVAILLIFPIIKLVFSPKHEAIETLVMVAAIAAQRFDADLLTDEVHLAVESHDIPDHTAQHFRLLADFIRKVAPYVPTSVVEVARQELPDLSLLVAPEVIADLAAKAEGEVGAEGDGQIINVVPGDSGNPLSRQSQDGTEVVSLTSRAASRHSSSAGMISPSGVQVHLRIRSRSEVAAPVVRQVTIVVINLNDTHRQLKGNAINCLRRQNKARDVIAKMTTDTGGITELVYGDRTIVSFNAFLTCTDHVKKATEFAMNVVSKISKHQDLPFATAGIATGSCCCSSSGNVDFLQNSDSSSANGRWQPASVLGPAVGQACVYERLTKVYDGATVITSADISESLRADFVHQIIDLVAIEDADTGKTVPFAIASMERFAKEAQGSETTEWMYELNVNGESACLASTPFDRVNNIFRHIHQGRVEKAAAELAAVRVDGNLPERCELGLRHIAMCLDRAKERKSPYHDLGPLFDALHH